MWGIFFEDINLGADGGIYAELIRNRAFQGSELYPSNLSGWTPVGDAILSLKSLSTPLSAALPKSVNVAPTSRSGRVGFANDGYWGMDVKVQKYTGSFWVRGAYTGSFTASLQSALTNETFGSVHVDAKSGSATAWTEHTFTLTPDKAAPSSNNTFAITFDAAAATDGSLDFNLISLFPPTWNDRPNGLRKDLAEALGELKPTFFRLPGGNMLEGNDNRTYWRWNESIGALKDRPGFSGVWNYEQTNGLGLVEYMLWAQDLKAEPGKSWDAHPGPPHRIQTLTLRRSFGRLGRSRPERRLHTPGQDRHLRAGGPRRTRVPDGRHQHALRRPPCVARLRETMAH